MKKYYRIMLGAGSRFVDDCIANNYIGADFDIFQDLTGHLPEQWQEFNKEFIPVFLANRPDKTKTAAGLACGFLYTICKALNIGDVVLSPDGKGCYYIGTITSDYYYVPDTELPHRRRVKWMNKKIRRSDMSQELRNSIGSIGTCSNATKFAAEIESLIASAQVITITSTPSNTKATYLERDLHKIFINYLRTENIIGKTIYHEKSSTKIDSNQKWVHPDIVGVKIEDFKEEATKTLQKVMDTKKAVRLCSYELKRKIEDDYQLKQYYFQALSNSNWANYGYLVAYEIDDSLQEEMNRLNTAFGIGIILLQAKPSDVQILCPAREKELDYDTIDKLCHLNKDFKSFMEGITQVLTAPKDFVNVSMNGFVNGCDAIFTNDIELEDYCKKNCIPF